MKWILHFLHNIYMLFHKRNITLYDIKVCHANYMYGKKKQLLVSGLCIERFWRRLPNSLQPSSLFCLLDFHLKKKICKDKLHLNLCISNLPLYWNLWSFGNEFHRYDGTAQGLHYYYLGLSARCPVYEKIFWNDKIDK